MQRGMNRLIEHSIVYFTNLTTLVVTSLAGGGVGSIVVCTRSASSTSWERILTKSWENKIK